MLNSHFRNIYTEDLLPFFSILHGTEVCNACRVVEYNDAAFELAVIISCFSESHRQKGVALYVGGMKAKAKRHPLRQNGE